MRLFRTVGGALGGVALIAAVGCSDPDTLTCDWLAKPDNCWKTTAAMATTCLPASTERGTFSADNSTCTYASGAVVTFTPPLTFPLQTAGDMNWNFTVSDATGQPCLHYESSNASLKLTVGGKTFSEGGAGLGLSFSCPDGTSVKTSNAFNIFNCPDGGFIGLPGLTWSDPGPTQTSPYFVSAGLTGTDQTSFPLFDCQTP